MRHYDVCGCCGLELRQKWRIEQMQARRDVTMTEAEIHGCARRLALLVFRDHQPPEAAEELARLRQLLATVDEQQLAYFKLGEKRGAAIERQKRRREKPSG